MKEQFIRFMSSDNIELCGMLYSPINGSKKTIIQVHGLVGNFYENRFVSYLARAYTEKGYNFITFNNRGNGYFVDLLKQDKEITFIDGGSYCEKFEESIFDIEGIINYLKEQGNEEIILQGHSYGCNKVIHYYNLKKDNSISKIILLAPCDIVEEIRVFMGDKYNDCVKQAEQLISENKGNELIDSPLFPHTFTAKTFMNDFMPNAPSDIFRYRIDNYIHESLKNISIPVLIEIGSSDECVFVVEKEKVDAYLKNNFVNSTCKINYIPKATHIYLDTENKLVNDILEWL